MEWLSTFHFEGIIIGICTFLIIGLFHPIVVKAEYYWGNALLVVVPAIGYGGNHWFTTCKQPSDFYLIGRIFLFFLLDNKRDIRTT